MQTGRIERRVRVIAYGETMAMLSPPPYETLEHATDLRLYTGGSEANVAVGLERLGMAAGWVGKMPNNALARNLVNELRGLGVDVEGVVWADQGRLGLFYLEWGPAPRPTRTLYDRAHSAATTLSVGELDWDYIAQAEWLHLTGISPALSETCRQSTWQIAAKARQCGLRVSFDLNYRSLLWPPREAHRAYVQLMSHADLVIATRQDLATVFGLSGDDEQLARGLYEMGDFMAAVVTCGDKGAIGFDGMAFYRSAGYDVAAINRIGAGDAFDAGLLYGLITRDLDYGLRVGSAMAALKMTIPQNMPLVDRETVFALLQGERADLVR